MCLLEEGLAFPLGNRMVHIRESRRHPQKLSSKPLLLIQLPINMQPQTAPVHLDAPHRVLGIQLCIIKFLMELVAVVNLVEVGV